MNRLSTRVDDILRLRNIARGFGGPFRVLAEMRELAWRCSEATDRELAAGAVALASADTSVQELVRQTAPLPPGMSPDLAIAFAICHLPDPALRTVLKDAFSGYVEAAAGRPILVERRRQARTA